MCRVRRRSASRMWVIGSGEAGWRGIESPVRCVTERSPPDEKCMGVHNSGGSFIYIDRGWVTVAYITAGFFCGVQDSTPVRRDLGGTGM
jgi:hypothetical protein